MHQQNRLVKIKLENMELFRSFSNSGKMSDGIQMIVAALCDVNLPLLRKSIFFALCWIGPIVCLAQPENDDCENAIEIIDVTSWCSEFGAFTNVNATASGYTEATCWNNAANDVWFTFTAFATDITILVNGNQSSGGGGTLTSPEVALYSGSCGGTINQQECEPDAGAPGLVELYKGGLLVGATYYIRVQGLNSNTGTFQLCVNNYNPPVNPGSDCFTSSVLCDKSQFAVQQVIGAGTDPNEAESTCLGDFTGTLSESNSTWFTWVCDESGPLTFTLTPLNAPDDLDFVLYELQNGLNDCSVKLERLCMASGDFDFPSPCMGPTGLNLSSTDVSEPAGCNDPSQDNFLAPLNMVSGTAYALIINNFSGTGNGFEIEFGGTGTFLGPQAAFEANPPSTICFGETVNFNDASFSPLGSALVDWKWVFGEGATPSEATGPGPHDVTWDTPGSKSVVLTVTSDLGCIVTEIGQIIVEPCCNDENMMFITPNITDLECAEIEDGVIDLDVSSSSPPHVFEWDTGDTSEDLFNLGLGDYMVTITNEATCDTVLTFTIDGPPPIIALPLIEMPTCNGGTDGSITLNVAGGTPGTTGFMYSWENGPFTSDNTLTNLPVGLYDVTIRDENGCELDLSIQVDELELVLASNIPTVTNPLCNDSFDGSVVINVANGTGPFQYNWNDGLGWTSTTQMTGLNNGMFNINFMDSNGCIGDTTVVVTPPTPVVAAITGTDISCFGFDDGYATVTASGGVIDPDIGYSYNWSDGQTDSIAVDLPPGNYSVTVTDGNSCTAVNDVTIIEPDEVVIDILSVEDVICFGDSTGVVNVIGSGGTGPYTYSIDGFEFQIDTTFNGLPSGFYDIIVEDSQLCYDTITAFVNQPPELIVDAGPDQTTNLGFPVDIQAVITPPFLNVDYLWTDSTTVNCFDCPRTSALPVNTTEYNILVTDQNGCTADDDLTVFVVKDRPVYIPNVFSPNNDGNNDYFTAYAGPAAREILLLRVFNRWGALVYEANNIPLNADRFGWDGKFKGDFVTPDVFAFYIKIGFIDDEEVLYEGDITVMR